MPSLLNLLGIYRLYEYVLTKSIKKQEIPKHIAIILDGNRRWASSRSAERVLGHIAGANTAEELLEWCHEIGIRTITLYLLSTENLNRATDELKELFELFAERLSKLLSDERIERFKIRVTALGRLELLTPQIRELLEDIEAKTKVYSDHFLNIAIAY
ncbi:MAG: polyprenyl diphosphate synthase, partial [Thaumarchaeota archaeon]|nr:polyprenyl diphosphate synthase [Nitrososphaerota archaeon]